MSQTHLLCFFASYTLAFFFELGRLWKSYAWMRGLSVLATVAGLIAQSWYLIGRALNNQLPPLIASGHDWVLVSAWLLVTGYLLHIGWHWSKPSTQSMGLFVLPAALILVLSSSLLDSQVQKIFSHQRIVTMLHASSLSLGITAVFIGFLISLMYLIQHRRLKKKQQTREGFSLPSLSNLTRLIHWSVGISMSMLTLGMVTGFILILSGKSAQQPFSWRDPVVIGFSIIWTLMVCLFVWLFRSKNTTGRQVALLNAWALGFLIVTLVGLQVLVQVAGIASQHN